MASSAALGGVILALIEGVGLVVQRYMGAAMNDPTQGELEDPMNLQSKKGKKNFFLF